ncbi:MAG: class I SAM-dependent methyltransferase [Caldilinea sp.]|nr:class I SAM-dependent methyltransferase [Caldilinea sp.]MDW8441659.1 class I SAM-dependent methyltransferase [Caldilineaceae bacterium]
MQQASPIPVIDYEGSQYRADFWMGSGRQYEDAAERLALQRLLPSHGGRIAEIGAGFGRLADLYRNYEQVILFDYSRSLLQEAVDELGGDERFVFVAGNLYTLPLASNILDSLVMVRVMHHLADVSAALEQLRRALHRHSVGVIEYANKRNLKAILRWVMRRQRWSPWAPEPVEFVEMNFNFHPRWMEERLQAAGLRIEERLAVSHFRLGALKARIDAHALARIDSRLFKVGAMFPLAPSVFLKIGAPDNPLRSAPASGAMAIERLFRCPFCQAETFTRSGEQRVQCTVCHAAFERRGLVWDFKEAVQPPKRS